MAAAAGFRRIGIRLGATPSVGVPPYDMLGGTPLMRETLARLADTGVSVLDAGAAWIRVNAAAYRRLVLALARACAGGFDESFERPRSFGSTSRPYPSMNACWSGPAE